MRNTKGHRAGRASSLKEEKRPRRRQTGNQLPKDSHQGRHWGESAQEPRAHVSFRFTSPSWVMSSPLQSYYKYGPIVSLLFVSSLVSRGPKQIFAEPGTAPAGGTMCGQVADLELLRLKKHSNLPFSSQSRVGKNPHSGSGGKWSGDCSFSLL